MDDRFRVITLMGDCLEDLRSSTHTKHSLIQIIGQRVYQIAAGYEDGNDADFFRLGLLSGWPLGKTIRLGLDSQCPLGWKMMLWGMPRG